MSSSDLGFFAGLLPGLAIIVCNMLRFKRELDAAQLLARREGEVFDFAYSASLKADYFFRPKVFVKDSDGDGIRRAKERLLLSRRGIIRRHCVGGAVLIFGAILGSFVATGLWPNR